MCDSSLQVAEILDRGIWVSLSCRTINSIVYGTGSPIPLLNCSNFSWTSVLRFFVCSLRRLGSCSGFSSLFCTLGPNPYLITANTIVNVIEDRTPMIVSRSPLRVSGFQPVNKYPSANIVLQYLLKQQLARKSLSHTEKALRIRSGGICSKQRFQKLCICNSLSLYFAF
jgi:hypothetical protein